MTTIVFDFDDTLFATTHFRSEEKTVNVQEDINFEELDNSILALLKKAIGITNSVYIISNAEMGWIHICLGLVPKSREFCMSSTIRIFSSMDYSFARVYMSDLWKCEMFEKILSPVFITALEGVKNPTLAHVENPVENPVENHEKVVPVTEENISSIIPDTPTLSPVQNPTLVPVSTPVQLLSIGDAIGDRLASLRIKALFPKVIVKSILFTNTKKSKFIMAQQKILTDIMDGIISNECDLDLKFQMNKLTV